MIKSTKNNDNVSNILATSNFIESYDGSPLSDKESSPYKISNFSSSFFSEKKRAKGDIIHSAPANKEWINSIYAYNKNYIKTLPSVDNVVNNLLSSYFNLTPLIKGKKSRINSIIQKRLTLNKVLLSKAEIKHTNDKINLTVYLHNRNKVTLLENLINLYESLSIYKPFKIKKSKYNVSKRPKMQVLGLNIKQSIRNLYTPNNSNLVQISDKQDFSVFDGANEIKMSSDGETVKSYVYKSNPLKFAIKSAKPLRRKNLAALSFTPLKSFTKKGVKLINKTRIVKEKIMKLFANTNEFIVPVSSTNSSTNRESVGMAYSKILGANYEKKYYSKFLNKYYLSEILYLYYIKALALNNNKFKGWFLKGLIDTISKLYNKKVELNLVNQKYFYLNSDIFVKAIATRVRNRSNNILREMKYALSKVSLPKANGVINSNSKLKPHNINEINIRLQSNIYNSLKYKHVNGLRLEAAGRLSRRLTAARSVFKIKSKGNLKNTDIIYNDKSVTMLRNNVKPNIQYTNINSKTRNGSFGLKGWINNN